ncbi:histidine kinase [Sulfolobus sp. A20]|uniref:CBS domain-containing protein n=1 Tax=Saccharolobus sp. A20 TaxID=1891280 RepID=UPI000846092D|nr:CBS domain-containing protein [Sulfolobus sp. A20]TRM76838.1 CBS domain-containing protein [Sulfolobus sp. E5]TRM77246.1 CBS domain-containing protein [Sulfolobus sp. A20-N-F8]TRM81003.1 CBS domain-containing protein [Sulfolobus sp. F3]TRM84263.1 CBS domain-containing protein [Sulfolobus sp. A20-N-F6]TRN04738.1 CBS domain-containing protein [Sulfolobus sp. E1]
MNVGDLINKEPISASNRASIREVAQIMKKENISSVIITSDAKPIGIVTERDIVRAVADGLSYDSPIETIMTKGLIMVTPDKDVTEALLIMYQNNIRHLVVINEKGNLLGVVSIRDVARALNLMAIDLSFW